MKDMELQEKENVNLQLKNKKKQKLKEKGITLIALVVTIIILLILAGVTLNMAMSGDGLFSRARNVADKYKKAQEDEAILIDEMTEVRRISTAKELQQLATEVNEGNTFNGWTIILMNDIDLSSESSGKLWTPIGADEEHSFQGNFDGNNKTISNLCISDDLVNDFEGTSIGLFGFARKCEIKNLKVSGEINFSSSENIKDVGGVAGNIRFASIQNIISQININVLKNVNNVGGIIGWGDSSTFLDCANEGSIETIGKTAGGIISSGYGLTLKSCNNCGNVKSSKFSRRNCRNRSISDTLYFLLMNLFIKIVQTVVQ